MDKMEYQDEVMRHKEDCEEKRDGGRMTAISGDYRTYKHIPSRSCVQIIIEVPEEAFPNVCEVLGYPITGESKHVGIALLNLPINSDSSVVKESLTTQSENQPSINEKTEGEKLRIRAVMLVKDEEFQLFAYTDHSEAREDLAISCIYEWCGIKSRSELTTNETAQQLFKELLQKFKEWQYENQYVAV